MNKSTLTKPQSYGALMFKKILSIFLMLLISGCASNSYVQTETPKKKEEVSMGIGEMFLYLAGASFIYGVLIANAEKK